MGAIGEGCVNDAKAAQRHSSGRTTAAGSEFAAKQRELNAASNDLNCTYFCHIALFRLLHEGFLLQHGFACSQTIWGCCVFYGWCV